MHACIKYYYYFTINFKIDCCRWKLKVVTNRKWWVHSKYWIILWLCDLKKYDRKVLIAWEIIKWNRILKVKKYIINFTLTFGKYIKKDDVLCFGKVNEVLMNSTLKRISLIIILRKYFKLLVLHIVVNVNELRLVSFFSYNNSN